LLEYQKNIQTFDQKAEPHQFKIGQKIWLSDTESIGEKNLTYKWIGPFDIIDRNDSNVKIKLKNGKFKVVNGNAYPALGEPTNLLNQDDSGSSQSHHHLHQRRHMSSGQIKWCLNDKSIAKAN
jgi:hypothetical protein